MYKHFVLFTLLIAVCSLAVWAGANTQKGKAKADVSKVNDARVKATDFAPCPGPRPKNRGCSIRCKPCQIAVCENGKWKYEKYEWPKEECQSRPLPGEGSGVCKIGATDACPPECKSCVRK